MTASCLDLSGAEGCLSGCLFCKRSFQQHRFLCDVEFSFFMSLLAVKTWIMKNIYI